jgi:hypothetical protein
MESLMGCIIEFTDSIRFNFVDNKIKQKTLIDVLLCYTRMDLKHLATLIKVPMHVLKKAHQGIIFLPKKAAETLGMVFLLAFS